MQQQQEQLLKQPRGRVEDRRLITGTANYVDDFHFENQVFMGIIRSPYAHAKIVKIDFSKITSPDFIASLTGKDLLTEGFAPLTQLPMQKPANRLHLPTDEAMYVGQAVAAVLVKNRYAVDDVIDQMEIEYEELPAILTIEQSKKNSPLLYPAWKENVAARTDAKKGDADSAIRSAAFAIKARMGIVRQAGTPIEPRSVVVKYDKARDIYEIHASVQSAHRLQNYLSQEMKIPKEKFHVVVKDVGGGFGTKGAQSYPENALACVFAKRTGLPVKWTSTRTEDLVETAPGRDTYCDIELACDRDGRIVALRAHIEDDAGVTGTLSVLAGLTMRLIPGAYKIPNLDLRATVYATNKAPTGPVRGAGRPEACYYIERAVDMLANKMGLDPIEFRRRNILLPEDFPYDNGAGFVYDSGNYPLLLDKLEKQGRYNDLMRWRDQFHEDYANQKRPLIAGIGVCAEVEDTGSQFTETARLEIQKNGVVVLYTGSSPHGQGLETSLAQLVSEELDIPLEKVRVIYGDTDLIPEGIGTFGSRSMATGGSAAVEASRKLKAEIVEKASTFWGVPASQIQYKDGSVFKKSERGTGLTLVELLEKIHENKLSASTEFKMKGPTFATAAHLCALTVDTETGKVKIERYVAVDDVGRIINEQIVDGQIEGGVIHGIGGSLYEHMVFGEQGDLLTSNFVDYLIPTSLDSPNIELFHVETPSTMTLNGAKGAGEGGTIAAYPTVINAVNDALSQIDPKLELNMVPTTPEAVFKVIDKSG